jgi:hypothetical protein
VLTGAPQPPIFNAAAVLPNPGVPQPGQPALTVLIATEAGMWGTLVGHGGGVEWATNGALASRQVFAVTFDPASASVAYAGTDGGLYKSTNAGLSWAPVAALAATGVYALLFDPAAPSTFYAGTNVGVFVSEDSGSSWTAINNGLTNPVVDALALGPGPDGFLYAATLGGGVFLYTDKLESRASTTGLKRRGPPRKVGPH